MRRWHHLALAILLVLATLPAAASARPADSASPGKKAGVSATQVSVRVDSPAEMRRLEAEIKRSGGTIARRGIHGDSVLVNVPDGSNAETYSAEIAASTPVQYAEPTAIVQAFATPTDPQYSLQWGLPMVNAPAAWDYGWGSASIVVAVVDSGVDLDHPDLVNQIVDSGRDFVDVDMNATDVFGHGTAVASVVAAQANNVILGCGMAPGVKILPVRVLGNDGSGTAYDVAQGVEWATDKGADVINLSLGSTVADPDMADAIAYALLNDVVVVAASGNKGTDQVQYPGRLPGVIAVGAIDQSKLSAKDTSGFTFSDHGPDLDLVAPGKSIYALTKGGGYSYWTGTSFAAPFVAGTAALMRSRNRSTAGTEVANVLLSTAQDLGTAGRDNTFGDGLIQADAAVASIPPAPFTRLDTSAPANAEGWYKSVPTITLTADRPATIWYHWGSDAAETYGDAFPASVGISTLTYWAEAADGTEEAKTSTFKVDIAAPSAPTGVTASALSGTGVHLIWNAAADVGLSDVKQYEIHNDTLGEPVGTTSETSIDAVGLTPGTTYTFSVSARDRADNLSSAGVVTYTTPSTPTPPTPTLIPIYRFYNAKSGTHFFTPSAEERDAVMAKWSGTFAYEGVAYEVSAANTQPLYRFYNNRSASHFYTASVEERDAVIAKWSGIFSYEGETYKVSLAGTAADAVYRFYNRNNGSHFFTASAEERDTVVARWSNVYTYEGPVFYLGR
jgi:subtilisin family serine protease